MNIFYIMLVSLVCTIVIENVFGYAVGIRRGKDFVNITLVNILTNPLVVSISFSINILFGLEIKRIAMCFLELSAFLIEGFIYNKYLDYKKINGYLVSLILNIASYSIGILINNIIW